MTDDNQNTSDAGNDGKADFGSDQNQSVEPQFGKEDIANMLKQNVNGQEHIKTLETETADLRTQVTALQQDLANAKSVDDLLDQLRLDNQNSDQPGQTVPPINEDQLLAKLSDKVAADMSYASQQALEQDNWNAVESALKQRHGDSWNTYVDSRAKELGMNNAQATTLARSNPKAFLELVSPETGTRSAYTLPSGTTSQSNEADVAETEYASVVKLKQSLETPEGREANRKWSDQTWQQAHRLRILEKAKAEGKL